MNMSAIVFFDLQKAIYSVPHKFLLQKLLSLGMEPHTVAWISSYLFNRSQRLVLLAPHPPPVMYFLVSLKVQFWVHYSFLCT